MKSLILCTVISCAVLSHDTVGQELTATNEQNPKVRSSGHVVDVDATPHLMDLVSKAKCLWADGHKIYNDNKKIQQTIDNLAKIDWYFANDLAQEVKSLDYCLTGPLIYESPYDRDELILRSRYRDAKQVGLRIYDNVYLDQEIYFKMNDYQRGMLLIHEAMHSYLDMYTQDRKFKLRSMVATIDRVNKGELSTLSELYLNMEKNEVNFPRVVLALKKIKHILAFVKATTPQRVHMLSQVEKPEIFLDMNHDARQLLTAYDQRLLNPRYLENLFQEALLILMEKSTANELNELLSHKKFTLINPLRFALRHFRYFNDVQKKIILEQKDFINLGVTGLRILNRPEVYYKNMLVNASSFLVSALNNGVEAKPLLDIMPNSQLSQEMMWLPQFIVILYRDGKLNRLTDNPLFYQALNLKAQKDAVSKMNLALKREKTYVLNRLDILARSLKNNLLTHISQLCIDNAEFHKILKELNL